MSTNAVREEFNRLSQTELLKGEKNGRNVFYSANTAHTLFPELRSMVQKVMGIDQVIDGIVHVRASWSGPTSSMIMPRARIPALSI